MWIHSMGYVQFSDSKEALYVIIIPNLIYIAPLLAILAAFVACIGLEVFNFACLALFVYTISTSRISNYHKQSIADIISNVINFISNGSRKDEKLKVLSINFGLHEINDESSPDLCAFIKKTLEEDEDGKDDETEEGTMGSINEEEESEEP